MLLQKFSDGECEIRPGSKCYFVLPPGEIGRLSAGLVEVSPGGTNDSCAHTAWRQVFFIIEGTGTLILDDEEVFPIEADMVCEIPYNAEHRVVASSAGPLRYIYINDYSHPVLESREDSIFSYKGVESEVHVDLERGLARMSKRRKTEPE